MNPRPVGRPPSNPPSYSTTVGIVSGAMDFPQLLVEFEVWMQGAAYADKTRHSYRYQLTCFWCDWAYERGVDLSAATELEIGRYLQSLPAQGHKRVDATKTLRTFYGWLEGRHRVDNPTRDFRVRKPKAAPAPDLADQQIAALLRAAFHREPRRGWAIMFCFATGARVGSLVAVRDVHVNLDHGDPTVWFAVAKGDRPYGLSLNRRARISATHLLELGHDPLIGVGSAQFRNWLHEAERDAGLPRIWPHLLRHAFARRTAAHVVMTSGDLSVWQRAMNHSDLSQFSRYGRTERSLREGVGWG